MNIPTLFKMFSLQMRAVLVDWLVEVQVQLKLLQVKCTSISVFQPRSEI